MKKLVVGTSLLALATLTLVGSTAVAGDDDSRRVRAQMSGYEEVPAVSTTGRGHFSARIEKDKVSFRLTYSRLEAPAAAAHIHFGQEDVNGGIVVFLCGGTKPACPATGTVTGTVTGADIIGGQGSAEAQGIAPGEFAEFVRAMRRGLTYANVHTSKFPGGEIRGQIERRDHDEDD